MKLKVRGENAEFINSMLERDHDIFVGLDADGNEIYTGDRVLDADGDEYIVRLSPDLDWIPSNKVLTNYRLKVK